MKNPGFSDYYGTNLIIYSEKAQSDIIWMTDSSSNSSRLSVFRGLITTNLFIFMEFKDSLSSEYSIESLFSCDFKEEGRRTLIVGYLEQRVIISFRSLFS